MKKWKMRCELTLSSPVALLLAALGRDVNKESSARGLMPDLNLKANCDSFLPPVESPWVSCRNRQGLLGSRTSSSTAGLSGIVSTFFGGQYGLLRKNRRATANSSAVDRMANQRAELVTRQFTGMASLACCPFLVLIIPPKSLKISLLISLPLGDSLSFGAYNSKLSGYRTRKSMRFFYVFFLPMGRSALSVRLRVALSCYCKLLPTSFGWWGLYSKTKEAIMAKNYLTLTTEEKHKLTLCALRDCAYGISEWLDAMAALIRKHEDISLDQILRMIHAVADENYTAIVGINERLTGQIEDEKHSAEFLAIEYKHIDKIDI